MSTRSVVFAHTESGMKGVYVHWDGYPEGRLPALHSIIQRDGVSKAVITILGKPSGWSHLSPEQDGNLGRMYDDGRFIAVPGYGIQYNDQPVEHWGKEVVQGDLEYRTPESVMGDVFIEFVYIIEQDGSISWAENDYTKTFDKLEWHDSDSKFYLAEAE